MNDPVLTAHGLSRWVWMPGQRYLLDGQAHRLADGEQAPAGAVPDLSDPVTAACLVQAVRRAWDWGDAHAAPRYADHTLESRRWVVVVCDGHTGDGHRFVNVSEVGALVAALEAAP